MRRVDEEEIKAVIEVLKRDPVCLSGYYKNPEGGPSVQAFEEALKSYFGVEHAVAVSSGTAALHVSLLSLGVRKGDEVIVPPLTFSATATSVLMCGAKPVFSDADPRTYNLDPEKLGEAITPKTKAVIPVHLLGTPCDMEPLTKIAEEHNIKVLEDNAQGFGSKYKGKFTETFGQASILSFQETKSITTGEGGAILTNDAQVARECKLRRNHGQQYAEAPFLCWNFRLTELQAAVGIVQLKKLDLFNKLQVENAKALFKVLPPQVHPPFIPHYADPTLYIVGCTVDDDFPRERFIEIMTRKGVNRNLPGATVSLGYTRTIMDLPLFHRYRRSCPVAETLVTRFLWFDVGRFLTRHEFKPILSKIAEAFKELEGSL